MVERTDYNQQGEETWRPDKYPKLWPNCSVNSYHLLFAGWFPFVKKIDSVEQESERRCEEFWLPQPENTLLFGTIFHASIVYYII